MNRPDSLDAYGRALLREIDLAAEAAPGMKVGAVQWGGGTPSQLGVTRLVEVSRRLAARFDRTDGAETSMEIDPRFCDEALVEAMAAMGVSRASLGVQDFDMGVQQAINRRQSVEDTAAAIERLRGAGIAGINIDLVYGLPHQTVETLTRTLDAALALTPDRFAVFGYAHVPWMKARQSHRLGKAQELFAQGDAAEFFYKVVAGSVRSCKLLSDGRRQIDAFHLSGDIVGLEAGPEHRFTAETLEDTTVRAFRRSRLGDLLADDPAFGEEIMTSMMRGLERA